MFWFYVLGVKRGTTATTTTTTTTSQRRVCRTREIASW